VLLGEMGIDDGDADSEEVDGDLISRVVDE
jgi:hypothetical protein